MKYNFLVQVEFYVHILNSTVTQLENDKPYNC